MMNDSDGHEFHYRRRIPHYQETGCTLFITFRLNFKLPRSFLIDFEEYKAATFKRFNTNTAEYNIANKKIYDYYDNYINLNSTENDYLKDDSVAQIIHEHLLKFDHVLYDLICYSIMPNHVHILIRPLVSESGKPYKMGYIMMRIKGATSIYINLLLNRSGDLWQREYFDYMVRSEKEYFNIIHYILMNPVKARLVKEMSDWKWSWFSQEIATIVK